MIPIGSLVAIDISIARFNSIYRGYDIPLQRVLGIVLRKFNVHRGKREDQWQLIVYCFSANKTYRVYAKDCELLN